MKKNTSRLLSTLLVLCMALALLPTAALAEEKTLYAKTPEELLAALKPGTSNVTVVLEGKDYTLDGEFEFYELENVMIRGTEGTRLMSTASYDLVVTVSQSKNVTLENLVMGHDILATDDINWRGVVYAFGTENLTIKNCEMFGGLLGIGGQHSTITVEKSTIHDCAASILSVLGSNVVFTDCEFLRNGYSIPEENAIWFADGEGTRKLAFYNCTFKDNKNPSFAEVHTDFPVVTENCTFTNNSWSDPPSTPSFKIELSAQNLTVDDRENIACEKYNIDGNNYFKLRDLAALLNGTGSQFEVGYDDASKTISITTGKAYTPNGSELVLRGDMSSKAEVSAQILQINGVQHDELKVYNIGGNNFFQLRQLGDILGFEVDYDPAGTGTAIVRSK